MLRPAKATLAALILAAGLAAPALARELTEAEIAALGVTVETFDAAMAAGDMAMIVKTIPDKMLQVLADQYKVDKAELVQQMILSTEEAMKSVTIEEYSMDVEDAEYLETPDGTPYALIPSRTLMAMGEQRIESLSKTLGLLDEGSWYLIRVDDPQQVGILQTAFPSFVGVSFPPGSTQLVTE